MAGPSVIATISAHDTASATLREFAATAKRLGNDLQKAVDVDGSKYVNSMRRANAATRDHIGHVNRVRDAWRGVSTVIAAIGASAALRNTVRAVQAYIPLEREERFTKAAGKYTDAEMRLLREQTMRGAQIFGETPENIVEAQKSLAQRGLPAGVTEGITEEALSLSKALGASIKAATDIIEGTAFAVGEAPKTREEAARIARLWSNRATVATKESPLDRKSVG